MPQFLGTVMGTLTCQDCFSDCWKTPAKGTLSRLVVVMVRVPQVVHQVMVRLMIPMVMVWVMHVMHWVTAPLVVQTVGCCR